jgi:mono/diheme cytochrome c family protein
MPSTSDSKESLEDRARAYLHTNCSQCHRPDGPTQATMDLRFDTPLADTGTCDAVPEFGDLGIDGSRLIAPGQPEASIVYLRASSRASHGMPPLGSTLVDHDGVELLASWIESMAACP